MTNPPYMGSSGMGAPMANFVKKYYPDSKSDLFAVFIEVCSRMAGENRYQAMITQHAWMFLSSYEKLREKMMLTETVNMAHLGARAFEEIGGEVVQTTSFVRCRTHIDGYKGTYCRLIEPTSQQGKEDMFLAGGNRYFANQDNFAKIPGRPVAYWASKGIVYAFENGIALGKKAVSRNGVKTGDNQRFVRLWWEVPMAEFSPKSKNSEEAIKSTKRWFPYNKGGEARKWYGNNDGVVNWQFGGKEIFDDAKQDKRNVQDYPNEMKFSPSCTWSLINTGCPTFRYKESSISDIAGMSFYCAGDNLFYLMALCNSPVANAVLKLIAPTINYQAGDIGRIPVVIDTEKKTTVDNKTKESIELAMNDWDSFETSWDFKKHPLV